MVLAKKIGVEMKIRNSSGLFFTASLLVYFANIRPSFSWNNAVLQGKQSSEVRFTPVNIDCFQSDNIEECFNIQSHSPDASLRFQAYLDMASRCSPQWITEKARAFAEADLFLDLSLLPYLGEEDFIYSSDIVLVLSDALSQGTLRVESLIQIWPRIHPRWQKEIAKAIQLVDLDNAEETQALRRLAISLSHSAKYGRFAEGNLSPDYARLWELFKKYESRSTRLEWVGDLVSSDEERLVSLALSILSGSSIATENIALKVLAVAPTDLPKLSWLIETAIIEAKEDEQLSYAKALAKMSHDAISTRTIFLILGGIRPSAFSDRSLATLISNVADGELIWGWLVAETKDWSLYKQSAAALLQRSRQGTKEFNSWLGVALSFMPRFEDEDWKRLARFSGIISEKEFLSIFKIAEKNPSKAALDYLSLSWSRYQFKIELWQALYQFRPKQKVIKTLLKSSMRPGHLLPLQDVILWGLLLSSSQQEFSKDLQYILTVFGDTAPASWWLLVEPSYRKNWEKLAERWKDSHGHYPWEQNASVDSFTPRFVKRLDEYRQGTASKLATCDDILRAEVNPWLRTNALLAIAEVKQSCEIESLFKIVANDGIDASAALAVLKFKNLNTETERLERCPWLAETSESIHPGDKILEAHHGHVLLPPNIPQQARYFFFTKEDGIFSVRQSNATWLSLNHPISGSVQLLSLTPIEPLSRDDSRDSR